MKVHDIGRIQDKLNTDYKLCTHCDTINWYENEECIGCRKNKFTNDNIELTKEIERIKDMWLDEGYDIEAIYLMGIQV